jgi:hypothetical protein
MDPKTDKPLHWPMRYTIVHWAALLTGLSAGSYDLCCRTIDLNGVAQPMPRPLLRTGVTAIHSVRLGCEGVTARRALSPVLARRGPVLA